MGTSCREARKLLVASSGPPAGALADHLADCAECSRFAVRRDTARELFREHRSDSEPDTLFADRVVARLPSQSDAALGWAVARVLPATVALLLVLVWLSLQTPSTTEAALQQSPTDDVLTWVLDPAGQGS